MSQKKRLEFHRSYEAVDEDGQLHTIKVFKRFIDVTYGDGTTDSAEDGEEHYLAKGLKRVYHREDGTLVVDGTNRILIPKKRAS